MQLVAIRLSRFRHNSDVWCLCRWHVWLRTWVLWWQREGWAEESSFSGRKQTSPRQSVSIQLAALIILCTSCIAAIPLVLAARLLICFWCYIWTILSIRKSRRLSFKEWAWLDVAYHDQDAWRPGRVRLQIFAPIKERLVAVLADNLKTGIQKRRMTPPNQNLKTLMQLTSPTWTSSRPLKTPKETQLLIREFYPQSYVTSLLLRFII